MPAPQRRQQAAALADAPRQRRLDPEESNSAVPSTTPWLTMLDVRRWDRRSARVGRSATNRAVLGTGCPVLCIGIGRASSDRVMGSGRSC